jgi:hypothetical protein
VGAPLVGIDGVIHQDKIVDAIPYFIEDSVMCVVPRDKGLYHRSATFTNDVSMMLLNYPPSPNVGT